ncbi:MAG TPA: alpha/beta fold hydrolase [Acidimicrobiia bacterium]|nr:alpha/beta fold hydrolase [Acidimicrobiia bacterium]
MILIFIITAGILAIGLFHLVAGWLFSNKLRQGALDVGPRPADLGVWVRNVDDERIELEAKEPRQDIGHPGVLGLRWASGYARVGDVIASKGLWVIREFHPGADGLPPVCDSFVDDCDPVDLDPFVYTDPGDVGLEFSEVEYQSPLGSMAAWLLPGGSEGAWAIHCHGWTAERRELIRMLPTFHSRGRTSLVIDYRNDPGMPTDPTGFYRFGLSEWEDLEGAVRYALDHGAHDIVLTGCSTGGALVMRFLERSGLAGHLSGIVLDAPNLILADTVRHGLLRVKISRLVREIGMWLADLRWRVDWEATNCVQRAETVLQVPTLVFHGTRDQTVPIATSRQLEARVPGLVTLVEVPAAGHVLSWNADPQSYENHLARFLDSL